MIYLKLLQYGLGLSIRNLQFRRSHDRLCARCTQDPRELLAYRVRIAYR